ncbi:MAG: hypothetical protein DELT_01059 [Desulfovibrio sp.]
MLSLPLLRRCMARPFPRPKHNMPTPLTFSPAGGLTMRNLFRLPSETLAADIALAMRAIHTATPLAKNHARELPYAVRDLSRLLTQDRSQLAQSYWVGKRLLFAYCRYFLPWNLLRLSWLLPNLDIPMPENGVILDLGSGPLTFPLALWLTKPEWRALPLTVVCADVSPAPLSIGRDVFRHLAPDTPWKIETVRAPLEKALSGLRREASLITAGNVLNELKPSRETPLEERLAALVRRIASVLAPEGRFLAMEPGTRLGGKLMALTRLASFSAHLVPESPCPHWGRCPMLEPKATGWCHFSHTTAGAPRDLAALTARAKLDKDHLNLSCLLLRKASDEEKTAAAAHMAGLADWDDADFDDDFDDDMNDDGRAGSDIREWAEAYSLARNSAVQQYVRILSDPIRLPDEAEAARYACSARGLVLAKNAFRMPSGAAVAVRWPEKDAHDAKSGALILELPKQEPRKPGAPVTRNKKPQDKKIQDKKPRDNKPRGAGPRPSRPALRKKHDAP